MTTKEKVINNITQMINKLENIKKSFEKDIVPGNDEWTEVAEPLNEIINVLNQGFYPHIKDKEWKSIN